MKRNIKLSALLLTVALIFALCGCKNSVGGSSSETSPSVPDTVSETSSAEETSSVESEVESIVSVTESSTPPPVSSVVSEVQNKPQKPVVPPVSSLVGGYTVNDPENTRGLDTTHNGYSYGVAKNGKPHSISVNNQAKFDSYDSVDALALDTVSTDKRMYLTFDCGYEYKNLTASILDTLKAKNVKAAFFCTLDYLEDHPNFVRRMIDEGHIVGNHSTTHPDFTTISRTKMAEELYITHKYLIDNFGYEAKYFRFPTGAFSESALELVTSVGYKSVFWSVAHADWDTSKQPSADSAHNTVTSRYHGGAVILLHAVSTANTNALGRMIDTAHAQGYTFKTLDDYTF